MISERWVSEKKLLWHTRFLRCSALFLTLKHESAFENLLLP